MSPPLKILIACESSGVVREAFNRLGHVATSCDMLETEIPGDHYVGDVRDILDQKWDLIIAHPPCTYLSSSGMHWTTRGLRDPQLTEDALDFVRLFLNADCPRIAVENPVGCISTRIRPADQYIHPYQFGDDASKKTGLWLKGLSLSCNRPGSSSPASSRTRRGGPTNATAGRTNSDPATTAGRNARRPTRASQTQWPCNGAATPDGVGSVSLLIALAATRASSAMSVRSAD